MHINIAVGRSCFCRCLGCCNHFCRDEKLLETKYIISFLEYLKNNNIKYITFCGGDPLSRPDIMELLIETKKLDFIVSVDTLGTPLIKATETIFHGNCKVSRLDVEKISKLIDYIGIALDGTTSETISFFRTGRKNIFEEQIKIINLFDKLDSNICINTVVHRKNIKDLENMPFIINRFKNIKQWELFQYMPIGDLGYKNKDLFEITETEFKDFCENLSFKLEKSFKPEVQFKSRSIRKNKYMLINTDGSAYFPNMTNTQDWNVVDTSNNVVVIGNIKNKDDFHKIVEFIK